MLFKWTDLVAGSPDTMRPHLGHNFGLYWEGEAECIIIICHTCGEPPGHQTDPLGPDATGMLLGVIDNPEVIRRIEKANGGPLRAVAAEEFDKGVM